MSEAGSAGTIRAALLAWYAEHRRDLPFRDVSDPYAVLISEVMLQQTQVARVVPFYEAWMKTFPDIQTLAEAPRDQVLRAWQGLGYYARARNLHKAAAAMVREHGGRVPDDVDALIALPGIGEYTAGAVASIAFGHRVPAVDGNVRRVLARLFAVADDLSRAAGARKIRALAAELADWPEPGDVNQALMELGATVCIPRRPLCASCSLVARCMAHAQGRQHALPLRQRRTTRTRRRAVAWRIVRAADGAILVARRRDEGLLGGLWEFPLVVMPRGSEEALAQDPPTPPGSEGAERTSGAFSENAPFGLDVDSVERRGEVSHVFSHLELSVTPLRAIAVPGSSPHAWPDSHAGRHDGLGHRPSPSSGPRDAAGGSIRERGAEYPAGSPIDSESGKPMNGEARDHVAMYDAYRWVASEELAALPRSVLMEKLERALRDSDS